LQRLTTEASGSSRCEPVRRVELAALQVAFQGFAQDAIPPLQRIQLLRSFCTSKQKVDDVKGVLRELGLNDRLEEL
jgi:hypothetical protein